MDGVNGSSYLPTSLDYINIPNPIQPAPQLQKHPLNGSPHWEKARLENTFLLILDPCAERAAKRQKTSAENPHLDLPKLPAWQNATRHRLPPTLSGLHQPPPESGLLPSINTEQPDRTPARLVENRNPAPPLSRASSKPQTASSTSSAMSDNIRTTRTKWTDDETRCLLEGVQTFGIGCWTKILKCSKYTFNNRTALDLKDRFRVCCPDSYKRTELPKLAKLDESTDTRGVEGAQTPKQKRAVISSNTREKYGVSEPFENKSGRRPRTSWSKVEDEAVLRGFHKHGNNWVAIRDDPGLGLSHRKREDLRGRMRTRYPEDYAKATRGAKKGASSDEAQEESVKEQSVADDCGTLALSTIIDTTNKAVDVPAQALEHKKAPQPRLFSLDDLYLGQFGIDEDADNGGIVLDRRILDWASTDTQRPLMGAGETHRAHGINPQVTVNLPKPSSVPLSSHTATSLPALATVLPPDTVAPAQLELPSLSQWYDDQSRALTLDEILS